MILTVTANPGIDRTIELPGALRRGDVQRAVSVSDQPGGKGVNVARVVHAAGLATLAVLPARADDAYLTRLARAGLPHRPVHVPYPVRTNITLAEPGGTTTKINEAGAPLPADSATELAAVIDGLVAGADWLVLCGSLPPGLADRWYADTIEAVAGRGCRLAVDTSGPALLAAVDARPALCKPNAHELAELVGGDGDAIEAAAAAGDPDPAADGTRLLADRTGGAVLTTLGGSGALLATPDGIWLAAAPPVSVRSTVGAGDASLAGYLIAHARGLDPAGLLRSAVAHGTAAASLPGTTPPTPDLVDETRVDVIRLD